MTLDFTGGLDYLWALLPETILCLCATGILLVGAGQSVDDPDQDGSVLGWVAMLGIAVAAAVNGWLYGVTDTSAYGMVAVDGFRLFSNWIFLLGGGLAIAISFAYVHKQRLQAPEYYALILFSTVGMMFMASARELILIFIALELMSLAVYVLAGFNRRSRRSAEAGLKYFLLGAFASGFFLFGVALVYGAAGSSHIEAIGQAVAAGRAQATLVTLGALLLLTGFAFKVSIIPFHMWTPDVYEGSPSPVTAFMAAAVKTAAFVAFFRVFLVAFGDIQDSWRTILWTLAALTMIGANLMALVQDNVKRMLAYSSIAHGGYLLVALVALNRSAAAGLLFYLLVYTIMNIGAFAVLIVVSRHGEERLEVEDYAGLGWERPALAVMLTVFLLSLAGFPGTGGFMGKVYLLLGARDAELWTLAVILVLTTVASYWYYLRVAWFMWMKKAARPDTHEGIVVPLAMRAVLVASVAAILLTGFFPGALLEVARTSVEGLMQPVLGALGGAG